jgi:hypothetical protein
MAESYCVDLTHPTIKRQGVRSSGARLLEKVPRRQDASGFNATESVQKSAGKVR